MMNKELVITRYKDKYLTAVYEQQVLVELKVDEPENKLMVGNIYVGKVKNIVKNINAAFVELAPGLVAYYSLSENSMHYFVNYKSNEKLVAGDEILVQLSKENIKTKAPVVTSVFNLPSRHLVLTANKPIIGVSNKIADRSEKERLKSILQPCMDERYGFVVRTSAVGIDAAELQQEAGWLRNEFERILQRGRHARCYNLIHCAETSYMKLLTDNLGHSDITIVTDIEAVYAAMEKRLDSLGISCERLRWYNDEQMSLINLKGIVTQLERALKPQVWLKSGGSLVIEQTEALVAIDVNTGKYTGKKDKNETFLKINLEAADEIARQLRLRNLSGIILIDFIDMPSDAAKKQLLAKLEKALSADRIRCVVVGMTRLNLVEVTRKKEHKPLHEQIGCLCPACRGRGFAY